VRRLYEPYAHPLMRIVQGVPMSWDPVVAAMRCSHDIWLAVWSPCSRFIAIKCSPEIQILDAATLKQIRSLESRPGPGYPQSIVFSPESRSLARLSGDLEASTSWDLQTGVPAGIISSEQYEWERHHAEDSSYVEEMEEVTRRALSITYSGCGTMFGILFEYYDDCNSVVAAVITTYNVLSRASVGSYRVARPVDDMIWSHGECIRFAAFGLWSITIWEVGFVSEHPATKVESIPTPDDFGHFSESLFLPSLSRLAFVLKNSIVVWDAQHSKPLLSYVDIEEPRGLAFSSDGTFFACAINSFEIYLWKDSPTGYALHRKLMPSAIGSTPLLSPDGRSILAFSGPTLQLWRTSDSIIPLSTTPTQALQSTEPFTLGFSPDESSVAVARWLDNTATVLDLRSGIPRLTIDAGMEIYGLRAGGSTVVVVGEGKIVTWNLPQRDHSLNATANVNDSIRSTVFNRSPFRESTRPPSASISPDFNYLVIVELHMDMPWVLNIYDMTTGKYLCGTTSRQLGRLLITVSGSFGVSGLQLTPNGHEVWCRNGSSLEGWAIVKDSESGFLEMESLGLLRDQPEVFPWTSSHGYEIVSHEWILNSNGKRLFWLPPHWQSYKMDRMWSGRFLALLYSELPEAVILEVLET